MLCRIIFMEISDQAYISKFLSRFPDLSMKVGKKENRKDFTLKGMQELMHFLGEPHQDFPSIHIAGSNGKGSVTAFCDAVLRAAGNKVGRFTSPHIDGPLEGIQINGTPIDKKSLRKHIQEIEALSQDISQQTIFEIAIAIAFLYFSQQQVDIAVIEVGLGGRNDTTNVIDPLISIITSIELEHQAILGESLEEIAAHKAGIIKNNTPLILAPQKKTVREILLKQAEKKNADVVELGQDFFVTRISFDQSSQLLEISMGGELELLPISLLGHFQIENAALAFAALRTMSSKKFNLDLSAIKDGFANTKWPGRFEIIQLDRTFILDAAHTPEAGKSLARSLKNHLDDEKIISIAGFSSDKNVDKIIDPLTDFLQTIILTRSQHPRALKSLDLAKSIVSNEIEIILTISSQEGIEEARNRSLPGSTILVFGSVFLVEEIRKILLHKENIAKG